jgi:hypothetical protein
MQRWMKGGERVAFLDLLDLGMLGYQRVRGTSS